MAKKRRGKCSDHPALDFFYELFGGRRRDIKDARRVYIGLNQRMAALLGLLLLALLAGAAAVIYWAENPDAGRPPADEMEPLAPLPIRPLTVFAAAAALAGGAVLILFSNFMRGIVRRLHTVRSGAEAISKGDLDARIELAGHDEVGQLADILNNMAAELKGKDALKREKGTMEKFISRSTRTMIQKSGKDGETVNLGECQEIDLSFLFADVRGFTAFAEVHPPMEVMATLNAYFDLQYQAIRRHGGDVDDYVGDQVMAHFGGNARGGHPLRACRAAVAIQESIRRLNRERRKNRLPVFEVGIGVHSGRVVTGTIGASQRMDFACVGDAVNTAARLCAAAAPGEILVSKAHAAGLGGAVRLGRGGTVKLKGKQEPLAVCELLEAGEENR
jgi:adenylate cyclase